MFWLYILRSGRTGRFYVGSTDDPDHRLRQHNGEIPALGRSTAAGRPWKLVFLARYASRSQAVAAERYVKRMKSKNWIEKLIDGTYRLPEF